VAQFVEALKIKGSPLDRLKQRNVAIAAGAVLALALAIVIAPSLMALLPDRAAAGQARAQAIQTQGMVHTLLERIETEERALEEALRRAHGDVDRQESALRSARTASERREAEARLAEVRQALAAETGVRDLAVQQIFKSRELVSVRGDVALGETALEDGDYAVAAAALGAARGKLEALLDLPVAAREAYAARARSAVAIERLESLARAEKRDVGNSVQALRGRLAQADAALGAGRARDAAGTYVAVAREAGATFNTLIDELIASYGELAQRAMNANELRSAQTAIDRAKALRAMKVPTA
jgi:hypothetical protein